MGDELRFLGGTVTCLSPSRSLLLRNTRALFFDAGERVVAGEVRAAQRVAPRLRLPVEGRRDLGSPAPAPTAVPCGE